MEIEKIKRQKLFELSYMLSPHIKDEELTTYTDKIKELITKNKGEINKEQLPQKRKLAYPIEKETQAYFGFMHFYFDQDKIQDIRKKLFLDKDVLRHLVITVEKRQLNQMQKPAQNITTQEKSKKALSTETVDKQIFKKEDGVSSVEEQKVDLKELDKKLEEILTPNDSSEKTTQDDKTTNQEV